MDNHTLMKPLLNLDTKLKFPNWLCWEDHPKDIWQSATCLCARELGPGVREPSKGCRVLLLGKMVRQNREKDIWSLAGRVCETQGSIKAGGPHTETADGWRAVPRRRTEDRVSEHRGQEFVPTSQLSPSSFILRFQISMLIPRMFLNAVHSITCREFLSS